MKREILIIGYGYVGKAMANMLKNHYQVVIFDPYYNGPATEEFSWLAGDDLKEHNTANYALTIICVPTPINQNRSCDTSIVEETIKKINTEVILIKSTISPGTTDYLKKKYNKRIVFSPEYVGEGNYWHPYPFQSDMKECPFLILGGAKPDTQYILDLFVPILGPKKTYYQCTAKEAEVIKYMENSYFGLKVIWANQMKDLCDALDVDYYSVRTGWALDPRVDDMHTMVFKDKRGFSGKCLPKDLNAIVQSARNAGFDFPIMKEVLRINEEIYGNNPFAKT